MKTSNHTALCSFKLHTRLEVAGIISQFSPSDEFLYALMRIPRPFGNNQSAFPTSWEVFEMTPCKATRRQGFCGRSLWQISREALPEKYRHFLGGKNELVQSRLPSGFVCCYSFGLSPLCEGE